MTRVSIFTVKIVVTGTAPLDGTTLFVPGERVEVAGTQVFEYVTDGPIGLIDIAEVLNDFSSTYILHSIAVENDVALHAKGSMVSLVSPDRADGSPGNRTQLHALGETRGIEPQLNQVIPVEHRLAFDTQADGAAPGPHTIQLTLSPAQDEFFTNLVLSNPDWASPGILQWKDPVRAASLVNVDIALLGPGSVMDSVTLDEGDSVGLVGQTDKRENGIYLIQSAGAPSVRRVDASADEEVRSGMAFRVSEGTGAGSKGREYALSTADPVILGTTSLTFVDVSGGLPPIPHASTHEAGGTDEISVAGLSGVLLDPQVPQGHASTHEAGGADEISVAGLSGVLLDPQVPQGHASTHEAGGADEIRAEDLGAGSLDTALVLQPDGAGGTRWGSGSEEYYDENTTFRANFSTTPLSGHSWTTPALVGGLYEIEVSYKWSLDATGRDFVGNVELNGSNLYATTPAHRQEPKDAAGGGPGGTNQRYNNTMQPRRVTLPAGSALLELFFSKDGGGGAIEAALYVSTFKIRKVG